MVEERVQELIQFPVKTTGHRLDLGRSCAGAVLPLSLAGYELEIVLPAFEFVRREASGYFRRTFGHHSVVAEVYDVRCDPEDFGYVYYSIPGPKDDEVAAFVLDMLLVSVSPSIPEPKFEVLMRQTSNLILNMVAWLEVLSFRDFSASGAVRDVSSCLVPFRVYSDLSFERVEVQPEPIEFILEESKPIDISTLNMALELAVAEKTIEPIHELMISALKHRNNGNFRGAVFDAATAVEVGLVQQAQSLLPTYGTESAENFPKYVRGLFALRGVVESLSGKEPFSKNSLENRLSKIRNSAIHKGGEVSYKDAHCAITFARDYIYKSFPPLNSSLATQNVEPAAASPGDSSSSSE